VRSFAAAAVIIGSILLLGTIRLDAQTTPTLVSISINPVAPGVTECVNGTNLPSTGTVNVNGNAVTSLTPWTCFHVPTGTPIGTATVQVVTAAGASNSLSFTVVAPPSLTSMTPTSGPAGSQITLNGTGFGTTAPSQVTFLGNNNFVPTIISWSDTQVQLAIPSTVQPESGHLQFFTSTGVEVDSPTFTVTVALNVTAMTPATGQVGTPITITGSGFGSSQSSSTVTFNGASATISTWSDTSITAPVPVGATTGPVLVTVNGIASNSLNFTVSFPPPTITALSPVQGVVGTHVTIAGTNFGATQGSGSVTIGGIDAPITSWSDTQIVATVATGATTGNVKVQQGGILSGGIQFTVQSFTLNASRYQHSATLLNDGTVLIAGGINCPAAGGCTYLASAEIYDPANKLFTNTGSLAAPRSAPAVLLQNGKVLIAGGYECDSAGNCASLSSAEIYDPTSHTFAPAANMTSARNGHTMTLLHNGQVLIAGGETCVSAASCTALNTAELYDPIQGLFTPTGSLSAQRYNASATALNSGLILIAGGFDGTSYPAMAELYDPAAGTFSAASNLIFPRSNATATLLNDGHVLVAGGNTCSSSSCPAITSEVYIPGAGFNYASFTGNLGSMNFARLGDTATLLTNGQVLLAGGYDSCGSTCTSGATTETYDPSAFAFTTGTSMATARSGHSATLLGGGSVVLIGGINNGSTLSTTDSYQPASLTPNGLVSITVSPSAFPMVLGTNLPLVATGTFADFSTQILQSVNWNSSSPSVAGITNDAGNSGIVSSQSFGSTTITASAGAVSGSSQITVTPPLVSLALSPANPSVAIGAVQQLQLTTTGVYSDGSSADLTPYVTWTTSDNAVAMVLPTAGTHGIVGTGNPGNVTITATFAGVSSSTSVTVTPPIVPIVPNITDVSPATATAGNQVTVTGTGFGSSQGNGSVWLGSTLGTIVTWSDTQVIAKVAAGSTTGIAQIQQAGISSNTLPFNVITPIISSVTPASGLAGTPVTINGTGFGTVTGQLWLGTAPGIVSSWSDTQILATVAAGSATGTVQVLQAGVVSNTVPFAVNTPSITSITPTSGIAGTSVTITGSGFGSAQGSGIVWIGSAQGLVVSWADTQVVASVDSNAVSGIVRIQQNGIWSNALSFKVPPILSTSPSVNINPNVVSMVVGETRSLQALDDGGNVLTGLTWASTDLTVATLSTDDPPIITALAPGHVTITAGNASADLTVYPGPTLPLGTVQWSIPGDGSRVWQILPAVPSDSGVDVFALQLSGNIQAVKTDGKVAWTSNVGTDKTLLPDFQGGLVVADPNAISKLDGITGHPYPAYTMTNPIGGITPPVLVHTDGTVFAIDGDTVVGIDPLTGRPKFNIQLEDSIISSNGNCGEFPASEGSEPPAFGAPIIAGDGFAYIPYTYTRAPLASNMIVCNSDGLIESIHVDVHFRILRVGTDGSATKVILGDWSQDVVIESGRTVNSTTTSGAIPDSTNQFGTLITNADQGAFYSWDLGFNGASPAHQLTTINGSGSSTISLPVPGSFQPMLQGIDGTLVGIVSLPTASTGQPGSTFTTALDALGNPKWALPDFSPKYLTDDGSVIAQSRDGTIASTLDQNGNTTGQVPDSGRVLAWTGSWYKGRLPGVPASFGITKYALSFVDLALSFWPTTDGNLSGSHHPPTLLMTHMYPFPDLTGVSADKIKSDTLLGVPLNPKTDSPVTHTFLIGDKVSSSSFLDAIESTSQATAFIGHSQSLTVLLEDGTQGVRPVGFLMGVERSTQGITDFTRLVMAPYDPPTPSGLEYLARNVLLPNYVPQALWIQQGPMRPRANVIFLGSCGAYSLPFQYWFNIHSDTKQHALIVPTDDLFTGDLLEVPAGVARFEWILIAQGMAQGKTIQQALDAANAQIHVPGQFDVVVPASFHWIAVGDANLKLRPTSK
jgi:hypothetical protein